MGLINSATIRFPEWNEELERFGFRFTGAVHIGKAMMLDEVSKLLRSNPPDATVEHYRTAVVHNNILSKRTQSNREQTYKKLRTLYGLDENIPIFPIYRNLVLFDPQSAPLLSLLVSWIRDPILRSTTTAVFQASFGDVVGNDSMKQAIHDAFPEAYSSSSLATASRNTTSTWTQSGHLSGRSNKVRTRVSARPASVAMALLLGYVSDLQGERLFTSPYCQLLDLNPIDAKSLASRAHKENLLNLKMIGPIVEVSFKRYQKYLEVAQ